MAASSSEDAAEPFDPLRPKLIRFAYRMLGSVADAEDVVQDAFPRWLDTDRSAVRESEPFLRRVVMRLCLDVLKSARRQREEVMQVHEGLSRVFVHDRSRLVRYGLINGLPGFITIESGETLQTTALDIIEGKVVGIYIVRNPDKLRRLDVDSVH